MSLALSAFVLFISLMQLVNGAQFLNTTFLLVLCALASVAVVINCYSSINKDICIAIIT